MRNVRHRMWEEPLPLEEGKYLPRSRNLVSAGKIGSQVARSLTQLGTQKEKEGGGGIVRCFSLYLSLYFPDFNFLFASISTFRVSASTGLLLEVALCVRTC